MKRIKLIVLMAIAILLTSCNASSPQEITDFIQTPKADSPVLEGTWQVTSVKEINNRSTNTPPKIGDRLYINDKLVAINSEYAYPPSFTSKFVNLSDYIKNRGFEFDNVSENESVTVINASDGQFFARDFIKRSNDEIFYIADDNIVYLSRLSKTVDESVIDKYTSMAMKERVSPLNNDKISDDVSLLLGVRERIDLSNGSQDYNYYTYLIRIPEDEKVTFKKANDIFVRGQDEYWKVRSNKTGVSGLYEVIEAFPVRVENQMDNQELKNRYSFKDYEKNMKLNFVDKDFISFSYTGNLYNNTITKYGFIEVNSLNENRLLTIDEYTGENDATEQLKNIIKNEANNNLDDIEPIEIQFDNTNFGLVRDTGSWVIQTSLYTKESQIKTSSQIPVRNYVEERNTNVSNISRDAVRNINPQFKDYYVLSNGRYIVIQTADEILIHRINDKLIEKQPMYSIPTPNPTTFISIDQQIGSNAEILDNAFSNSNTIVDRNTN